MPGGAKVALAGLLLLSLAASSTVLTDGNSLYFSRVRDGLRVSLFGPPMPLIPGPTDFSVMVQDAGDLQPIVDARVVLMASQGGRSESGVALTHRNAADRLLFAGSIDLPRPGPWRINLQVTVGERKLATRFPLTVMPSASFSQAWPYFALVLLVIFLFGCNQWLRWRQRAYPSRSAA
jgi:hypothetical protein